VNLLLLLLVLAIAMALLVVLGERFLQPLSLQRQQTLQRWLLPLVGLSLVLAALKHYLS